MKVYRYTAQPVATIPDPKPPRKMSLAVTVLGGTVAIALVIAASAILRNERRDWQLLRDAYENARAQAAAAGAENTAAAAVDAAYIRYLRELRHVPRWRVALAAALAVGWFAFLASMCIPRTYAVLLVVLLAAFMVTWALLTWIGHHQVFSDK